MIFESIYSCAFTEVLKFDTCKAVFYFPFLAVLMNRFSAINLSVILLKIIICSQGTYLPFKEQ